MPVQRANATAHDGHARRKVAIEKGEEKVPVIIGSWDEATEAKILATLDPLSAMANADAASLEALLNQITTESQAVEDMLADLAKDAGLGAKEKPDFDIEEKFAV